MSTLAKFDSKKVNTPKSKVVNFMGNHSYIPSSLQELKLIANSSIFGEPSYYRPSKLENKSYLSKYDIFYNDENVETTEAIFENAIDKALNDNFGETLKYAVQLRNEMNMRLNPAVILMRAALHKNRIKFNEENPGVFNEIMQKCFLRPDDVSNQFDYFMFLNNGKKNGLPNISKKSWAKYLSSLTAYQIAKYKENAKIIDMVRISHAKSELIDELMKTGSIKTKDEEKTWENFRSEGKTWKEILSLTYIPHMALLRNLRNIFTEITDIKNMTNILEQLVKGVKNGKQFPYRYYNAYKMIENENNIQNKELILDYLNKCIEVSISETPKLKGKTISLVDNSGSSWGTFNTKQGDGQVMNGTQVAIIGNLSGLITGKNAEDGHIGIFGDNLKIIPVDKKENIFEQLKNVNSIGKGIGGGTENGSWLFFRDAIKNKEKWDNIFIYSDMQMGHGGLYGKNPTEYKDYSFGGGRNIDLIKLVNQYRKEVNPNVNIVSVQIAGYNNSIMPENLYRGAILSGWTGKESDFLYNMDKVWTEIEENNPKVKVQAKQEEEIQLKTMF